MGKIGLKRSKQSMNMISLTKNTILTARAVIIEKQTSNPAVEISHNGLRPTELTHKAPPIAEMKSHVVRHPLMTPVKFITFSGITLEEGRMWYQF